MRLLQLMVWLLTVLLVSAAAAAEGSAAPEPTSESKLEVIELSVHPALPPDPALRYRLLPEQTPGNAVGVYTKVFMILGLPWKGETKERDAKVRQWLETPLESLPREEVREVLARYREDLEYVKIAARRERCDWDPPPSLIFSMLAPEIQAARFPARLVALRARLEMAEGKHDDALTSLQTGYAMARQIAEQPLVIAGLVGLTIEGIMDVQLQELLTQPDVANLYWTIAALPDPLIDVRRAMFPEVQLSGAGELSSTELSALAPKALPALAWLYQFCVEGERSEEAALGELLRAAPSAKEDLIARGHRKEKVEALEPGEAVFWDLFEMYNARRDQLKWLNVPYWQACEGIKEADAQAARSSKSPELTSLADMVLPSVEVIYAAQVWREQRMASLRCVEALRLYAATHEGSLPASLDAIREVPVPINPATGKTFRYRLEGKVAVLDADGLPDGYPRQYRVSVVK